MRGKIISYTSNKNSKQKKLLQDLTNSILKTDEKYATDPFPELYKKRLDLQSEFNLLSTKMTESLILPSRDLSYECRDKNSRLLAHQLRRQEAFWLIPQIRDRSDNLVSDPQDINKVFEMFYTSLYKSELPSDISCMDGFLNNL